MSEMAKVSIITILLHGHYVRDITCPADTFRLYPKMDISQVHVHNEQANPIVTVAIDSNTTAYQWEPRSKVTCNDMYKCGLHNHQYKVYT